MLEWLLGTNTGRRGLAHAASYTFLILVGVSMIFPLVWMVVTSVKAPDADVRDMSRLLPQMSFRINRSDVLDWQALGTLLTGQGQSADGALAHVGDLLDDEARESAALAADVGAQLPLSEQDRLITSLNTLLQTQSLWTDQVVAGGLKFNEPPKAEDLLARRALNRRLLDRHLENKPVLRPAHRFYWENYRTVMVESGLLRATLNSFFITLFTTFGMVFTSSLAAFAFARMQFPGRDKIFMAYLATMMIPGAVTMIPAFLLFREFGWINTYKVVTLPGIFTAYGTFMLRQFFMSLPTELEESALLDGCSLLGIYRHVIIPLSKPALAALSILTFMGAWGDFMWPLIVLHSHELYTLPIALQMLNEMHGNVQWTLLMAGSMIQIVPMFVIFLFGQRFFISGLQLGAVKG
ncbi:MAG: carbohydrate ABC transporter permease [Kiritimatiellaeota bacterium]|nr:carbohydrate ABC transporter permease [Kiritimatiellota bacterium]